jgi:hypothetical protein
MFLAFQEGVAAGNLGVAAVEFRGATDDLDRILGGDDRRYGENEQKQNHGYSYGSAPDPVSSGRVVRSF